MGRNGSYLAVGDSEPVYVPAVDCDVVDTTGAGNQFTAALIHARLFDDASAKMAGQIAARAAAQNCTARGPRGALATRADLSEDS